MITSNHHMMVKWWYHTSYWRLSHNIPIYPRWYPIKIPLFLVLKNRPGPRSLGAPTQRRHGGVAQGAAALLHHGGQRSHTVGRQRGELRQLQRTTRRPVPWWNPRDGDDDRDLWCTVCMYIYIYMNHYDMLDVIERSTTTGSVWKIDSTQTARKDVFTRFYRIQSSSFKSKTLDPSGQFDRPGDRPYK